MLSVFVLCSRCEPRRRNWYRRFGDYPCFEGRVAMLRLYLNLGFGCAPSTMLIGIFRGPWRCATTKGLPDVLPHLVCSDCLMFAPPTKKNKHCSEHKYHIAQ